MKRILSFLFLSLILLSGCTNTVKDPTYVPTAYNLQIPQGFPEMTIPPDNALTKEGVALGRKLYYDNKLDKDGNRACATCHLQSKSFTSGPDVLPHINLGWSNNYLWNSKISGTVEDIMRFEVEHFFETNVDVLNGDEDYPTLFKHQGHFI